MVLHYCDVGILLVLSEWIERYLEYSYPFIVLCWIGVTQKIENFFHLYQNPHSSIQTIEPRREIKMAQRSDKTRWKSNSFYDLSHPPDICRADGWWDWMSDEGGDLLTHNFIFVLLQICENIPLCVVNVTWQWSKSQTEMKGAWPLMSRGEEREVETAMLEEEPRLRSRGRNGSDLLVPTPDPRWSRSGRCVHTWCITHSDHLNTDGVQLQS